MKVNMENLGISKADNKDEKNSQKCTRVKTKCFMLFFIIFIFILFLTGFVMWFTEINNNLDESSLYKSESAQVRKSCSLPLSYNSSAFNLWTSPRSDLELRIHLFNYTNTDRYLKGLDTKLIVEELGPYVYMMKVEKLNVTFNDNHTLSYRENRSYKFMPEKSKGHQNDILNFPNIALLTVSSNVRHQSHLIQMMTNALLVESKAFKRLTAHEFIWGYDEPILALKNRITGQNILTDNKFGMLMTRNGTSRDVITMFNGVDDIRKLSLIYSFNGQPKMDFWSAEECNKLDGSDGSQFPPHWMDKEQPLQVFIKEFCRKFPLVYDETVNILNGTTAWRYKAPLNSFAHPDSNTANSCYCNTQTNECPPSGLFNATLCFLAPIFLSFPHFFTGHPKLFGNIEGLHPDEEKHRTYADVLPTLAFPIDGASRFQMNVQVQKAYWLTALNQLEDGQYLPILWTEENPGTFSDELREMLYQSALSANATLHRELLQ